MFSKDFKRNIKLETDNGTLTGDWKSLYLVVQTTFLTSIRRIFDYEFNWNETWRYVVLNDPDTYVF